MHAIRNPDGQFFAGLGYRNFNHVPEWCYPEEGGQITIAPKATWPTILANIETNFGIKIEGELVRLVQAPPYIS